MRERAPALGTALVVAAVLSGAVIAGGANAQDPALAKIAFASGGRIFTIEANGTNRVQLTGPSKPRGNLGDYFPVFSPDGARLAFVRVSSDRDFGISARIHLMDADGGNQEPLTRGAGFVLTLNPQWAPGGQWLAFARFSLRRGSTAIVVMRSDGTGRHAVVERSLGARPFGYLTEPAWDPDGSRLAYTRTTFDRNGTVRPSLHLVDRDGTNRSRLARNAGTAAWSPNGARIAFASIRDQTEADCDGELCVLPPELYVMDADGTNRVRLTRNRGYDTTPDWSADGEHLVFASDRNFPDHYDSAELYSIEPDGDCLTWLTNGFPGSFAPDWEPNPLAGTDPPGCGAVPRTPLVEARGRVARRVKHFKPLWLGMRYRSMLLTNVRASAKRGARFEYDDCGRYDPRECGPEVELSERWVCSAPSFHFNPPLRVRKRRGALVSFAGRRNGPAVNSGAAQVEIDLYGPRRRGRHQAMGVVDALRHLRKSGPRKLARAHLPRRVLRELRRQRLADDLRRLGRVKAIGCPRRPHRGRRGVPVPIPQPPPALRKIAGAQPWVPRNGGYVGRMRNDG